MELNGFEVLINKNNLSIVNPNETAETVLPEISTAIYQTNGNPIVDGDTYEEVIVTVSLANEQSLGTVNSVVMKDASGNIIEPEETVTGNGSASFRITQNGDYTVEVMATTNGIAQTNSILMQFLEGGILGIATQLPDIQTKAEVREAVELMLLDYTVEQYLGTSLIDFLNTQQANNKLDKVTRK